MFNSIKDRYCSNLDSSGYLPHNIPLGKLQLENAMFRQLILWWLTIPLLLVLSFQ